MSPLPGEFNKFEFKTVLSYERRQYWKDCPLCGEPMFFTRKKCLACAGYQIKSAIESHAILLKGRKNGT